MAIQLDIKSELPQAIRFTNEHVKQLGFSASQAINAVAAGKALPMAKGKNIISDWERFTKQKLDRPTPSLAKGFAVERGQFATKRRLSTLLVGKTSGWNRNRYILGNIKGGDRPNTWADQFSQKGTLPAGTKLVPTRNLKRDPRTGGPSYSAVKRLLNKAGSNPSGGTGTVFVGKPAQGIRPFGVYKVIRGGSLQAMFIAKPSTSYPRPLARLESVANARVRASFGTYLRFALQRNVAANVKAGRADMRTGLFR
nr:phage minor tail protein Z [uncultured Mediterranean phage uvMED]